MEFIIGPCAIESRQHAYDMAERLKQMQQDMRVQGYEVRIVFKASYSKPNRSDGGSFSGVGIEDGLIALKIIQNGLDFPVTSDVHTPEEATLAGTILDVIQIPHQLCKNTPLIVAAAKTGKQVSVKKGTFYDARLFHHTVNKIRHAGNFQDVIAIERGNHFGYGNTVVDMRNLALLGLSEDGTRDTSVITCLDATHPGGGPEHAKRLACAGVAAGAQMIFIETHDNPAQALCDGQCAIPIEEVPALLRKLCRIEKAVLDDFYI